MRIISGSLRNRRFELPNQAEVSPTKEVVREAVFSVIGRRCDGLRVLDLFAGSGALGLEAWSRGAQQVDFVEKHAVVVTNLKRNIEKMNSAYLGGTTVVQADALIWLSHVSGHYDLILADPPYELPNVFEKVVAKIAKDSILTEGGTVVYELRNHRTVAMPDGWQVLSDKAYGKTRILLLEQNRDRAAT